MKTIVKFYQKLSKKLRKITKQCYEIEKKWTWSMKNIVEIFRTFCKKLTKIDKNWWKLMKIEKKWFRKILGEKNNGKTKKKI